MTRPSPTLAELAPMLAEAFRAHGYTVDGLAESLGAEAISALARSDAPSVRRHARAAGPAGLLVRLFVLGDALPEAGVAAALRGIDVEDGIAAGLWTLPGQPTGTLRALVDLRPVDTGHGTRWVFADPDGSMVHADTRPDHVLGIGQATLSLLRITPTSPVDTVLDLGTGCGIQLVHALETCRRSTGTDITPRCLELAAATLAINGLQAELLNGPWFEPVSGRRFDRIVANPPFVVGPSQPGHSYRESGMALDGASRTVISGAPAHLAEGGTAILLASWVEGAADDWRSRVASWVPAEGVDAWILRRDSSDPELYVWTWLTDEGMDPRDESTARAADAWLDHFQAEGVSGIGFGYVFLRRVDGPSSVLCEDLTHPFGEGLGDEAEAYFARTAWLRGAAERHGGQAPALDATVFTVSPDVRLHMSESLAPGRPEDGADDPGARLAGTTVVERVTGARWRHEIDPLTATVLRGARMGALPLEDLVVLAAAGAGEDPDALADPVRRVMADLFLHGFVVPAGVPGLLPPGTAVASPPAEGAG
ncbi:class I SAM-dependent methyltransferase [Dietzia sp. UBA5065]|uniref:class I SAM-dependent methyltransferase n=1 Tax=Dietzia sp. UBA5065 TaxID=1946422 RepID=UPI0025C0A198|nr:class I SAM-dependent methyltransferase [Dietzia sp. UBA5065]